MLTFGLLVVSMLINPETVSAQCTDGMLQLINTATLVASNAGRLEVCLSNSWGTIQTESSESFWSEKNMLVACRQLQFNGALNSVPTSQLGFTDRASASKPVHYANVMCTGTESNISECDLGSSVPSFNHLSDVYLVCWPGSSTYNDLHFSGSLQAGDFRLVGDTRDGRGVVEIYTNLGWSTICPDGSWTDANANINCQLLGYESGRATILTISSSISPRLVSNAQCSTTSQTPSIERIDGGHCSFLSTGSGSLSCAFPSGTYAGVTCSTTSVSASARLFGLDTLSSDKLQGVVEYLADDRWGVLCRPTSTIYVSEAICGGLGYIPEEAEVLTLTPTQLRAVESDLKPLWIPSLTCDATDTRFSQCNLLRPLGYGTCGSAGNILAVDCGIKKRGLSSGQIAGIVVPTLIVVGLIIFLIIKKDEWVPKMKASSWYKNLSKCLSCEWAKTRTARPRDRSHPQPRSQPRATIVPPPTPPVVVEPSPPQAREETAPAGAAAAVSPPPPEEPALDNPELSQAAPPSYQAAFNLPQPNHELPPSYFSSVKGEKGELGPSFPPPVAYPVSHGGNPSYPPPTNPAYPPPDVNPAYPPPAVNPAYPPSAGNQTYIPPGANSPYPPTDGNLVYPASYAYPAENVAYPTSMENQVYPAPPPSTGMAYPPAT